MVFDALETFHSGINLKCPTSSDCGSYFVFKQLSMKNISNTLFGALSQRYMLIAHLTVMTWRHFLHFLALSQWFTSLFDLDFC